MPVSGYSNCLNFMKRKPLSEIITILGCNKFIDVADPFLMDNETWWFVLNECEHWMMSEFLK